MNLRDVKRRDKIIVNRREEERKMKIAIEEAKQRQAEQQRRDDLHNKRRLDSMSGYEQSYGDGYNRREELMLLERYSSMLLSDEDDWEMRQMKMDAIRKVMGEWR